MNLEQLFEAWRANCAINARLLALCADEDFELKPGKGKTIRSNWVHIVGVRRAHLEESFRKEASLVPKLDWKTATRIEIEEGLRSTDELVERLFRRIEEEGKPARWTAPRFFGYSVAHEAHHRSQIEIALRINGREMPDGEMYGLWEAWSTR